MLAIVSNEGEELGRFVDVQEGRQGLSQATRARNHIINMFCVQRLDALWMCSAWTLCGCAALGRSVDVQRLGALYIYIYIYIYHNICIHSHLFLETHTERERQRERARERKIDYHLYTCITFSQRSCARPSSYAPGLGKAFLDGGLGQAW